MIDVLAYSSDVQVWTPGVRYAAELAANLGGTLTALHVAPPWPQREPRGAPPSVMAELLAYAQEEIRVASQAGARFAAWARAIGVGSAAWHVAMGDVAEVLGAAGNWSDLIVIDRRTGDRDVTTELLAETLLAGHVCMAVPADGDANVRFDRIFVAFDGSPAAVRALHASMPLLERAQNVLFLRHAPAVARREAPMSASFDPVDWLRARQINVRLETLDPCVGSIGQAILDASSRNRTDLLVCGVRGKPGLDENRLDGVARHVLACSGVPALMAA